MFNYICGILDSIDSDSITIDANGNLVQSDIVNAFDDITSDEEGRAVVCTSQDTSNGFALDGGEEGDVIRIVRGI